MALMAVACVFVGVGIGYLVDWLNRPRGVPSFADQLVYGVPVGDPSDGLVLSRDWGVMVGYEVSGPDRQAMSEGELIELARSVKRALESLGWRCLISLDAVRRPTREYSLEGDFNHPLTAALEVERSEQFSEQTYYVTSTYLVIVFYPPSDAVRRVSRLFVEQRAGEMEQSWRAQVGEFFEILQSFEVEMARAQRLQRLSHDGLASHLRTCVIGSWSKVRVPEGGAMDLSELVGSEDFVAGFEPMVGERHVRVVRMKGYPDMARSDAMEPFHSIGFEARSSHRIQILPRGMAERLIGRRRFGWFRMSQGRGAKKGPEQATLKEVFQSTSALEQAVDARRALDSSTMGETGYAIYNWNLVVSDVNRQEAERKARELVEAFTQRGFVASLERMHAPLAYLGSLPGHGRYGSRQPILSVGSLSVLAPTTKPWLGHEFNPSKLFPKESPPVLLAATEGATTPYRVHLHTQDVGHFLAVGGTGAGKSTLLAALVTGFLRYPRSRAFVVDRDFSAGAWILAAGGDQYELAPGSEAGLFLQPLGRIDEKEELTAAAEWLEICLSLQGVEVRAPERDRIWAGLELLRSEPPAKRTLSGFRRLVQGGEIKSALRPYTSDGLCGQLFEGREDFLGRNRLQGFEMSRLLSSGDAVVIPALTYLFWRIEQAMGENKDPVLFVIDEAWTVLSHPVWSGRVERWLRRMRKKNGAIGLVTQGVGELLTSGMAEVVLGLTESRFVLPDARAKDKKDLYGRDGLGLTEREIEVIAAATSKREYLHTSREGSRLIDLKLGPLSLAAFAPGEGENVDEKYRDAMRRREVNGSDWFAQMLEKEGRWDLLKYFESSSLERVA